MSEICLCDLGYANTGQYSKQRVVDVAKALIAVPTVADDGTNNNIPSGTTVDATYITARINDADASKRWYPMMGFKNVTDERADSNFESFSDNTRRKVSDGVRNFLGQVPDMAPVWKKKIDQLGGCNNLSFFAVDGCAHLIGTDRGDGNFYPTQIEPGTWDSNYIKGNGSDAVAKVQVSFDVSNLEKDASLRILKPESDANLLRINGLLDVNAAVSGESTTGFVAALALDFGYFGQEIKVEGWTDADFSLYNETQAASVTITSVTESPEGTYTFVIPSQNSADVMTLTDSKDGYELNTTVTIP